MNREEAYVSFCKKTESITGHRAHQREFANAIFLSSTFRHQTRNTFNLMCLAYECPEDYLGLGEDGVTWESLAKIVSFTKPWAVWAAFLRKAHDEKKDRSDD